VAEYAQRFTITNSCCPGIESRWIQMHDLGLKRAAMHAEKLTLTISIEIRYELERVANYDERFILGTTFSVFRGTDPPVAEVGCRR
jgi:hypothetical protein